MPQPPAVFREFGIIPDRVEPPTGPVRASLGRGTIIGQYIGTAVMSLLGLGMSAIMLAAFPFPGNLAAAVLPLALFATIIYLVGRHDYAWIEIDGDKIRAQHLYSRRITEHSVAEIEYLLTLVFQVNNLTTTILNAWQGRVRGIEIRFRNSPWPLRVSRADPAMKNAQPLMEAIVYRMSQVGEIDAEVIDHQGSPLVRRIVWGKVS